MFAEHRDGSTPLAQPYLRAHQGTEFSCPHPCVQQEHNDGSISHTSCFCDSCYECLFFLVIQVAWGGYFLSYQLDHLCRIMLDVSNTYHPCKVPFEADERAIDGVWLEMHGLLQIVAIVSEGRRCDQLRTKRRFFLARLLPYRFTPDSKVAQITEVVADGDQR